MKQYLKKIVFRLSLIFLGMSGANAHANKVGADLDLQEAEYSIVFVHLGNMFPSFIKDALEQARLFNPMGNIVLLANQVAIDKNQFNHSFELNNIILVPCEELTLDQSHDNFIERSRHDKRFRDGFWLKTTDRFFYLEAFLAEYDLNNVFHLENDNMLYADLSKYLNVFTDNYDTIAGVFESDARCIPSFMFIRSYKPLQKLVRYIAEHAHKGINDMHIIAMFKDLEGRESFDHLPVIPQEYPSKTPLRNNIGQTARDNTVFYYLIDEFKSVFDGASFGQYLGGIDPRNGKSISGFINESAFFNPSDFSYVWIVDEKGRYVPHLVYNDKKYPINNLHIHSKNLKQFRSDAHEIG